MTSPDLSAYIQTNSIPESELLQELYLQTLHLQRGAHMISGPEQGRFLSWMSQLIKPKTILELGTFTGYSALCLAEGLQTDGKLYTLDQDEIVLSTAKSFFSRSAYKNQIIPIHGKISYSLTTLDETYDLIFIDADKKEYQHYAEYLIPKLKTGGLLISDNVLWKGRVIDLTPDRIGQYMIDYNHFLNTHPALKVFILNMRDGLSLAQKI
jgi:predicted O-methyltransferase YrrM